MDHTVRTTVRIAIDALVVALVISVGTVTAAAAIPVPEPGAPVATSRAVDADQPTGHWRVRVVHVAGQDWLPARRVG